MAPETQDLGFRRRHRGIERRDGGRSKLRSSGGADARGADLSVPPIGTAQRIA
jgi:hypothetical protein